MRLGGGARELRVGDDGRAALGPSRPTLGRLDERVMGALRDGALGARSRLLRAPGPALGKRLGSST
jgi:hypothetical protein